MIRTLPLWTNRVAFRPFCTMYDEWGFITRVRLAVDISDACARISNPWKVRLLFVKGSSFTPQDPLFSLHSIALLIRYPCGNGDILGQRPRALFTCDGDTDPNFLAQFPELNLALENIGLSPQQFLDLTRAYIPAIM